MVRRRPCASRFARARLVAVPAVLGQAAPGGVVARLVAAPVRALGPVVPDAVPRSDSSPRPGGSSGRRRCARPRRSPGRGRRTGPRRAPRSHRRAGAGAPPGSRDRRRDACGRRGGRGWAPPGSRDHHSTREGGRRDRRATREDVCQGHDLAGRPAISRIRPEWGGMGRGPGPRRLPGPGLTRAGPRPAETGTGLRKLQVRSTESRGRSRCGPGTGLHNASPARHRPPRLAPCEPSATESARARSARAHLAQCEPR